jgi:hypothetical protein
VSARARAALGERDANHAEIASCYRDLYCKVHDTSSVGSGFPDLVVSIPTNHGPILQLVEIKTEDGVTSASQERFQRDFGPVTIVRSRDDVIAHYRAVVRRFRQA